MPAIHAIRTGLMKVRRAQMESGGTGPARIAHMLLDEEWTRTSRIVAPGPVRLDGTTIVRQGKLGQLPVGRRYRLNTSTASQKVPAWDS
jgi:hypothetical protein